MQLLRGGDIPGAHLRARNVHELRNGHNVMYRISTTSIIYIGERKVEGNDGDHGQVRIVRLMSYIAADENV